MRLKRLHPVIVGIGGASGKSSVATLTAAVLSDYCTVLYQEGKNSDIGIPLAILDLKITSNTWHNWVNLLLRAPLAAISRKTSYDVYVAEMGIDGPTPPDNMGYLLDLFVPDIALLTNIAFEHSANFPGSTDAEVFESIAREELSLLHSVAQKDGMVILNADDPRIMQEKLEKHHTTTYSIKDHADLFITRLSITKQKFELVLSYERRKHTVTLPFGLPAHYAQTILAVLSIALARHIRLSDAIMSLEKHVSLPAGRATIFNGIKETTLIDSSYNSSLQPLLDMLDFLNTIHGRSRRVAILGDMRELGEQTQSLHEQAARKIVETVDMAILIGPAMREYVLPVLKLQKIPVLSFMTFSDARSALLQNIKKGDMILVKGSQNTLFLERVVELLLANPMDAARLCRRGSMWDRKRAQSK